MWKVYLIMFIITSLISWIWVNAIDKMGKEHSDYKGEDFLNWDGKNPWQIDEKQKKEEEKN